MIERVEERFDLKPARLIGDIAYGASPMLGWLVEQKQIAPHIPVWDRTQRDDETLSSSDFQWDEQADEYHCPQGKGSGASRALKARRRITLMYASIMVSALGPRLFAARCLREAGLVRKRIGVCGFYVQARSRQS
jgi:hypothetical protein